MSFVPPDNFSSPGPYVSLNILDTFIPGYSTISRLLLDILGFDITYFVSVCIVVFVLAKSANFLRAQAYSLVMQFFATSVSLDADADAYFWIMTWLAERGVGEKSHHIMALPINRAIQWQLLAGISLGGDSDDPMAKSFRSGKPTQRYEPALGSSHYFWHRGRLFSWHRQRELRQFTGASLEVPTTLIEGRLFCLSRSTQPLKQLIEEASVHYYQKTASKTVIRRPAPRKQRQQGGQLWKIVTTRPSRPLNTVVLEDEKKTSIISDIEEYLRPHTRRWYAERGIPYRRGYVRSLISKGVAQLSNILSVVPRSSRNWKDVFILCYSWRLWS